MHLGTNEPIYKTETYSQTERTDLWLPRGKWRGRKIDWEFVVSGCKLLYLGWINSRVLQYRTRNYIQSPGTNHNGKEYEKEYTHTQTELLPYTAKNTTL